MFEIVAVIIGFGLYVAAVRRLGTGSDGLPVGLIRSEDRDTWPRGVQEEDVPRFAIRLAD